MAGSDSERAVHSTPRSGRASVPMWDSSDPERAPPPLPLNERQAGDNASPTRPNTSEHVAAAARALIERGRANWDGAYSTNPPPERSPERIIPNSTPQHKRLKSLQDAGMKDIRTTIESPSDYSSRPSTPSYSSRMTKSPSPTRSPTATPTPRRNRDVRQSIFGEGSPTSETMLALRNMQVKDDLPILNDITNDSAPSSPTPKKRPTIGGDIDNLYNQIQQITTIATHLQKEMTALSRRSKDNATDLVGLREATNARDEDIRRTLKDLVTSVRNASDTGHLSPRGADASRTSSAMGYSQPPFGPSNFPRMLQLPKLSFEPYQDHERAASPVNSSPDLAASVAMLEKILREMVTKEGQEKLLSTVNDLLDKSGSDSTKAMQRLEELVESLREKSDNLALVRHESTRRSRSHSPVAKRENAMVPYNEDRSAASASGQAPQAPLMSDELKQLLQRIKDSVSHGGGIMGEVKSLVRELRGEVLGMGRDLGRKLDQVHEQSSSEKALVPSGAQSEYQVIIQESLNQLQDQMTSLIEERQRESSGSSLSRNTVDSQEIVEAIKAELAHYGLDGSAVMAKDSGLDRDSILAAIRDACEENKPEIELQQFGLERDEILQCLKEGLEDYQANKPTPEASGISRDEIMETIHASLQEFQPHSSLDTSAEFRESVVSAVREVLQEMNLPANREWKPTDLSRDDVMAAVKDGLGEHAKEGARVLELDQEGLLDAVKAGLEQTHVPYGQQVIDSLHDIIGGMREEFKEYSAANGRDTEQVLDALKDGLESLRAEIESYVDRSQDVTGKDEIIDTLKAGINSLQDQFQEVVQNRTTAPDGESSELSQRNLIDYIKTEFESIHDAIEARPASRDTSMEEKEQIIQAITQGFAALGSAESRRGMDEPSEDLLDAFKAEFEQLREDLIHSSISHKDEILESMQDSLAGLHQKMSGSDLGSNASYDIINSMRDDISSLRDSMQAPVLHRGDTSTASKDEIIESLKAALESIRVQLTADQGDAAQESLGLIREELESFRAAIGGSLMLSSGNLDKEEIIEAIKAHFDGLPTSSSRDFSENPEHLAKVMEEIERLRESFSNALQPVANKEIDATEFKEALQVKLDELKSHFENQIVSTERGNGPSEEFFVGTLSDHLDTLKTDISKLVDKPVDMTVSYEILETLKEGLNNVRGDIDNLKSSTDAVVLADVAKGDSSSASLQKSDIERMEVMVAQLQIKVEAMDANLQHLPQGEQSFHEMAQNVATKDNLASVETLVRELQASVADIAIRNAPAESGLSSETNEAIETLLQNTKAKIDDHVLPGMEKLASREHLETVEAMVKLTHEAAEGLTSKIGDNTANKDDIAALAHLLDEVTSSLTSIKERFSDDESEKLPSKIDVDAVGGACLEIKDKLNEVAPDALPSKADVEQLSGLLQDLRDSHSKLNQSYERDIEVTAKAFDDRKEEASHISDDIAILKGLVEETREELKQRLRRGNADVRAIDEILLSVEEKIDASNALESVKEVAEVLGNQFEKSHETLEAIKTEQGEQASSILEKSEEHRLAIITELKEKMEEHFKELLEKHDASKAATEEAAKTVTEKSEEQEKLLSESRAAAEELKVTIDTLGAAVTGIDPALKEATEKMTEDAQTVFTRVDDIQAKLDGNHGETMAEHATLRDEFAKAHSTISELRGEVAGQHPQYMEALKSLLEIAEQHFEHSRKFQEMAEGHHSDTKAHFDEGITRLPVPQIEAAPAVDVYDDSELRSTFHGKIEESHRKIDESHTSLSGKLDEVGATLHSKLEEFMQRETPTSSGDATLLEKLEELLARETPTAYDDASVHTKLDTLLSKEMPASLDDTPIHSKLDELMQHVKTPAQLEKLDDIHRQVMTTADEISALLAVHQKSIEANPESTAVVANPASVDLSEHEQRKESLEKEVVELAQTKEALDENVASLRKDTDSLTTQKMRLSAEVSSLETALRLRREELHEMDERAKQLERRVMEGIMDHSRALLLSKQPRQKVNMNLKRVTSNNSNMSSMTTTPTMVNSAPSVVSLALKPIGNNMVQRSKTTGNPASRRHVSLNQISNNVPSGAKAYAAAPRQVAGGLMSLKRSQSTRTPQLRKTSWQPGSLDKENGPVSEESEIDAESEYTHDHRDEPSRATSYTGTSYTGSSYTGTMSETGTYEDGSIAGDSEYTYGTGSYFTGSTVDRRSSDGSVIRSTSGTIGIGGPISESIYEEDEGEESGSEMQSEDEGNDQTVIQHEPAETPLLEEAPAAEKPGLPRLHTDGYDSGLGSDLPTADLSALNGSKVDYFKDVKQEKAEAQAEAKALKELEI